MTPEAENALNALSFCFPAGETFFIVSVRNYAKRITDPILKDQVSRFIHQEAMHTKEHARSNRELREVHPYGAAMEKIAQTGMSVTRFISPKITQLAVSCAIEHFTAILADVLLRQQERVIAESEPAFAALWLWHAVEETEHKAVCFDVYQHVAGRGFFAYLHRVVIMVTTTLTLAAVLGGGFAFLKWKARRRLSADKPGKRSTDSLQLSGVLRDLPMKMYRDYFRYSFHPWQHDNRHLIDEWKALHASFGRQEEKARMPPAPQAIVMAS